MDAHQYNALKELLALERDVIVSARTGSGKSAVAILPALVENGYTVIVCPTLNLIEDWERRLASMGVPFERYIGAKGPTQLGGRKNIILVSSDVAKGERFKTAIHTLHNRPSGRPVLRYVFDEAQSYYMDFNFRKEPMGNPHELRQFPCQVALFSATISLAAEKFLKDAFILSDHKRFSTCSDRPNLTLKIMRPYHKDLASQISKAKEIINFHLADAQWRSKERYLVYVNSHADGEEVAKALGIPFYHASSTAHPIPDDVRKGIFNDWLAGKKLGIVATIALAAGFDYAYVRFTVHISPPFDLVTLVQEIGRAGRDGKRAYNYVLPPHSFPKEFPVDPMHGDMRGAGAICDLVYYSHKKKYPHCCLTFVMTQFMDGQGSTCADLGRTRFCQECCIQGEWVARVYLEGGRH